MTPGRHVHTSSKLPDGSVLVAGGVHITDYPTTTERVTADGGAPGPQLPSAEGFRTHTATLLDDGRLLVAGGYRSGSLGGAYLLQDGAFVETGALVLDRFAHRATRLLDGRVLITAGLTTVGGPADNVEETSSELFDPDLGEFVLAADLLEPRFSHTATLLNDGRVLVCGGAFEFELLAQCEYWTPEDGLAD